MKFINLIASFIKEKPPLQLWVFLAFISLIIPLLTTYVYVRDIRWLIEVSVSVPILISELFKLLVAVCGICLALTILNPKRRSIKKVFIYLVFILLSPSLIMLPYILISLTDFEQLKAFGVIVLKTQITPTLFCSYWFALE